MRSLIYCFFLGLLVTAALSGDLKIKTITKPDKCYPTARTGDTIEVHYIGNYHVSRQFVKFVGPGCEIREDDIIEDWAHIEELLICLLGKLQESGQVFDSSYERGEPIEFVIGEGEMIEGFEQGVIGACVGERRVLTIPPELAYNEETVGPIPPFSTLTFDINVIGLESLTFWDSWGPDIRYIAKSSVPIVVFAALCWFLIKKINAQTPAVTRRVAANPYSKSQLKRDKLFKPTLGETD